jgi:hypothetical protein
LADVLTERETLPFREDYPEVLAIYCSDGRFTEAVEKLVVTKEKLGLFDTEDSRVDTLTIPGGPGLIDAWTAHYGHSVTVRDSSLFLIKAHNIKFVVLVAHEGCGHYRSRFPSHTPDAIKDRQLQDLLHARAFFNSMTPEVKVACFYATVVKGRIKFETVE